MRKEINITGSTSDKPIELPIGVTRDELYLSLRIIRIHEVEELTGLAKSSIYALILAGKFPKQVQLSTRCRGWRFGDVMSWVKNLKEVGND